MRVRSIRALLYDEPLYNGPWLTRSPTISNTQFPQIFGHMPFIKW